MEDSPAPRPTLPVAATAVWGVLLFPGLLGAALSPMFFDAPGSMNNPAAWANALIVASFPVLCLIAIAGSWIVWSVHRGRPRRHPPYAAIAFALLPVLPIAYVVAAMIFETVGVLMSGQPLGLHSTIIKH
ncbi:MAG TPA: hypothetical protein VKR05_07340 [Candidatus Cybelea sp.]|nr:hypothetical protein [Candidatus Cybelea sp.]